MVEFWKQGRNINAVYTDEPHLEVKLSEKYGPPDTTYCAFSRGGVYAWHWVIGDSREQVEAFLGREITPHEVDASRAQRINEYGEISR